MFCLKCQTVKNDIAFLQPFWPSSFIKNYSYKKNPMNFTCESHTWSSYTTWNPTCGSHKFSHVNDMRTMWITRKSTCIHVILERFMVKNPCDSHVFTCNTYVYYMCCTCENYVITRCKEHSTHEQNTWPHVENDNHMWTREIHGIFFFVRVNQLNFNPWVPKQPSSF